MHAQVIAGSSVYVRQDSDRTTVIAPRLHVGAPVDDTTRVDLVYTADVWTSASIDIRTSASRNVHGKLNDVTPITEQRDELDGSVTHEWNDLSLTGTYRYSHEADYESHGGTLTGAWSFAEKSSTLDFRLSSAFDRVGRAGDPGFHHPLRNLGARLGFTQLIDSQTFVQLAYELMSANGFNSSPYRWIGIGTSNGLCHTPGVLSEQPPNLCFPESLPRERLRHAMAANLRRALGESLSFGLGYRFYFDDWSVMSHTVLGEVSFMPEHDTMISLRYRFYTQGSAKHFKPSYDITQTSLGFYTNDKELSSLVSHRLALDLEHSFELDTRGHLLTVVLSGAPSLFQYANFRPIKQITAVEVTLATVFKL